MWTTGFHIAIGLCGFALICGGLFLAEDQEGKLQNRLELLWVKVDDLSKVALSKQSALIQQASELLSAALDRLFGMKVWSWKAVALSVGLSNSSIFLFQEFVEYASAPHGYVSYVYLYIATLIFSLSVMPGTRRYSPFIFLIMSPPLMRLGTIWRDWGNWHAFIVVASSPGRGYSTLFENWPFYLIANVGGVLCDVVLIAFVRWLLSSGAKRRPISTLLGSILLSLLLSFTILFAMVLQSVSASNDVPFVAALITGIIGIVGTANIFGVLLCYALLLLIFIAILHRILWPALSGPVYALQRYGVFKHPILLTSLGVSCLLFAWPKSPLIQGVAKAFHFVG